MGDYDFAITEFGRERARRYSEECTYFGSAPVTLPDYLQAMAAQSIAKQQATEEDLRRAFNDLVVSQRMLDRLGPAINSGRGMFLFGSPGNGKTSIAERVTRSFGTTIWIPRTLGIDGDIIRLYDPGVHDAVESETQEGILNLSGIDRRWVQIVRPTVAAGGELTMSELEVTQNAADQNLRSAAAAQEQLRRVDHRRLRPADHARRNAAQPLDRAAGKAVRLPQYSQRQKDSGAVRPADHLLDQPRAEGPGRRSVPAANSVQDRGPRSDRRAVPRPVQTDGAESRLRIRCGGRSII